MKLTRSITLITALVLIVCSCKRETELPVDMGYKYFPVNIGHWVIYDVDSVSHNDFTGTVDSFKFQIREQIESVFNDNEGRPTQRIERYKRISDTSAWFIKDVWTQNLTSTTAERTEENIRIVKLIFRPEAGAKWDGNIYNTNLLNEDFEKEVYAAHTGLIYKKYTKLSKQPTGVIISGIDYSWSLNSCGN